MSDPRNVAHDKKVAQEKAHEPAAAPAGAKRKSRKAKQPAAADPSSTEAGENATAPAAEVKPEASSAELEKSLVVLSKLKDMEFHSRANIEVLAELTLTIEEELKQKEFVEPIGTLYSAQDGFHTGIATLIETYEKKCESLRGPA